MRFRTLPLVLVLTLSSLACVSKQKHEETLGLLAACEDEKAKQEAAVISWEQRFDRESSRWEEMGASVTTALPKALEEFHSERDRIIELVPEQVKTEVADYLDKYFATVMKGFSQLQADNSEIKQQLSVTHTALEAVGTDTRSIGTALDTAMADERAKRERMAGRVAEIVNQVTAFDRTQIDCKECEDRLKLNRKQREEILAFHAEVIAALTDLQTTTGE